MMFQVCDVYDCEITRIFLHAPPFSVTYEKLSFLRGWQNGERENEKIIAREMENCQGHLTL
jgi:hypothetical protein